LEFWQWFEKDVEVRQTTRADKLDDYAANTERAMTQWETALRHLGRTDDAAKVASALATFQTKRPEYMRLSQEAGVQSKDAPSAQ
jgi:hypothetical protein